MLDELIKKLPSPVLDLSRQFKAQESKLYLYGETLCDLLFTDKKPYHYQMATCLDKDKVAAMLNLGEDIKLRGQELVLYFKANALHCLTLDFLPDDADDKYTIGIRFVKEDFIENLKRKGFSIDGVAFDFHSFYHIERAKDEFNQRKLQLSDQLRNKLAHKPVDLAKFIRYLIKYDFELSDAIYPVAEKDAVNRTNRFRWKREFLKLMELDRPSFALELMREWKVLELFFPELLEGYGVYQNEYHEFDVYYHSLSACDAAEPSEPLIRISALLHDIGKPRSKRDVSKGKEDDAHAVFYDHENIGARMSYHILKRLGFPHPAVLHISKLVRLHMFYYTPQWSDSAVRRFIRKAEEDIHNLFKLRSADRIGSGKKMGECRAVQTLEERIFQVMEEEKRFKVTDLAINGNDLMTYFDLAPGPVIGKVLSYLLTLVVSGDEPNDKESLISAVKDYLNQNQISSTAELLKS